jgi:hypothetical protein
MWAEQYSLLKLLGTLLKISAEKFKKIFKKAQPERSVFLDIYSTAQIFTSKDF